MKKTTKTLALVLASTLLLGTASLASAATADNQTDLKFTKDFRAAANKNDLKIICQSTVPGVCDGADVYENTKLTNAYGSANIVVQKQNGTNLCQINLYFNGGEQRDSYEIRNLDSEGLFTKECTIKHGAPQYHTNNIRFRQVTLGT